MTENLPAKQTKANKIEELLRQRLDMVATVLPQHITPERMLRVMFFALQKTPRLADCTPASIMESMVTCSEYGLEPGPQGHVYLIPRNISFKDRAGDWHKELRCTVQVGWRGLSELAWRSGALQSPPQAHAIHERDEWSYELGLDPKLTHKPALSNRGKVIAAYAVAHLKGADRPVWRILGREDLDRRAAVGDATSSARKDWGPEMDAKTAMRALCSKDLPMSPEKSERLYKVIENENTLPDFGDVPLLEEDPQEPPRRGVEALKARVAPKLPPAEEYNPIDEPTHDEEAPPKRKPGLPRKTKPPAEDPGPMTEEQMDRVASLCKDRGMTTAELDAFIAATMPEGCAFTSMNVQEARKLCSLLEEPDIVSARLEEIRSGKPSEFEGGE